MVLHSEVLTGTASSGTFNVNTRGLNALMRNLVVKPTTETTTYDIKLDDRQSAKVFERIAQTGTYSVETAFPLKGIYTMTITNASADEAFTIELVTQE